MIGKALGVVLAVSLVGCGATSYEPANSPRISLVRTDEGLAYVRDGRHFSTGVFGGGLVDAVTGNPQAESEARTAHSLTVGGFVCSLSALATVGAGVGLIATGHSTDTQTQVGIGLVAASLIPDIIASVLYANASGHSLDAINIYNDGVLRPPGAVPPMTAPAPVAPPATQ
ncbi:MAG TPA: hypothetical protein VH062_35775 [Polyangiaceae bacterium]|nr:hypothetical protein [Polyangiaceae bacterium]